MSTPEKIRDEYNHSFFFIKWFYPKQAYQTLTDVYGSHLNETVANKTLFENFLFLITTSLYFFQRWFFPELNQFITSTELNQYYQMDGKEQVLFRRTFSENESLKESNKTITKARKHSGCIDFLYQNMNTNKVSFTLQSKIYIALFKYNLIGKTYTQEINDNLLSHHHENYSSTAQFYQLLAENRLLDNPKLKEIIFKIKHFAKMSPTHLLELTQQTQSMSLELVEKILSQQDHPFLYKDFKQVEAIHDEKVYQIILNHSKDSPSLSKNIADLYKADLLTSSMIDMLYRHAFPSKISELVFRIYQGRAYEKDPLLQAITQMNEAELTTFNQLVSQNKNISFQELTDLGLSKIYRARLAQLSQRQCPFSHTALIYIKDEQLYPYFYEVLEKTKQKELFFNIINHYTDSNLSQKLLLLQQLKINPKITSDYSQSYMALLDSPIKILDYKNNIPLALCLLQQYDFLQGMNTHTILKSLEDSSTCQFLLSNSTASSELFFEYLLISKQKNAFKDELSKVSYNIYHIMKALEKISSFINESNILEHIRLLNSCPNLLDNKDSLCAVYNILPELSAACESNRDSLSRLVQLEKKSLFNKNNAALLKDTLKNSLHQFEEIYQFLEKYHLLNLNNLNAALKHLTIISDCINKTSCKKVYIDQRKWNKAILMCEIAYHSDPSNKIYHLFTDPPPVVVTHSSSGDYLHESTSTHSHRSKYDYHSVEVYHHHSSSQSARPPVVPVTSSLASVVTHHHPF